MNWIKAFETSTSGSNGTIPRKNLDIISRVAGRIQEYKSRGRMKQEETKEFDEGRTYRVGLLERFSYTRPSK